MRKNILILFVLVISLLANAKNELSSWQKAAIATRFASEVKYNFADYDRFGLNYDSICLVKLPELVNTETDEEFNDKLMLFKKAKRGKVIGTPTAGSTGQPIYFNLGWGYYGEICTRHERLADGTEFMGVGIQPDIYVEENESVIFGKDNVIEEALKELQITNK